MGRVVIHSCQHCGQQIGPLKRADAAFCSTQCRQRYHRQRERRDRLDANADPWPTPFSTLTQQLCAGCGSWVLGHWVRSGRLRADAKFCSPRCRTRAHRARRAH